jgi:hypothetical protein
VVVAVVLAYKVMQVMRQQESAEAVARAEQMKSPELFMVAVAVAVALRARLAHLVRVAVALVDGALLTVHLVQ